MYSGRFTKTIANIGECEVAICNAKSCEHNESKRCVLKEIAIDGDGKCMQFNLIQKKKYGVPIEEIKNIPKGAAKK